MKGKQYINASSKKLNLVIYYILDLKKWGIIASIFMIIVSILALPSPYIMKIIIDKVLVQKNLRLLNWLILLLVGLQLAKLVFSFLSSYFFGLFSQE
ncbi:MAG: ABC transporter ATP-binding protein, partial [Promethearchaeota archaeon]